MPQKSLSEVATEARHAIQGLEALLGKINQQEKRSRKRLAFILAIYVPIAMLIAMGVTVTIVSGCFLGSDSDHPGSCSYIPGYSDAIDANNESERKFARLLRITDRNDRRLTELETRVP